MNFSRIIKFIKKIFTPCHLYTLDYSVDRTRDGHWIFKEFGTHTYVKKNWEQLVEGDFLGHVNPKDIAYIAEIEAKIKFSSLKLSIHEEKRNCMWVLKNGLDSISISGKDFLKNRELIDKTESLDATKIAYHTGIKEGREISASLSKMKEPPSPQKNVLTLIK